MLLMFLKSTVASVLRVCISLSIGFLNIVSLVPSRVQKFISWEFRFKLLANRFDVNAIFSISLKLYLISRLFYMFWGLSSSKKESVYTVTCWRPIEDFYFRSTIFSKPLGESAICLFLIAYLI